MRLFLALPGPDCRVAITAVWKHMTLLDGRRRVWGVRVRGFKTIVLGLNMSTSSVLMLYVLLPLLCLYCAVFGDVSCRGMFVAASTRKNTTFGAAFAKSQRFTKLAISNAALIALFGFNL